MEKKELKWYEAPMVEAIDMEVQTILCVSTNADNAEVEDGEVGEW